MKKLRIFNTIEIYNDNVKKLLYPTISKIKELNKIYAIRNPLYGISSKETIAGDICLYDSILKKNIFINNNDLLNYSDISRYTPIGVVVVPRNT